VVGITLVHYLFFHPLFYIHLYLKTWYCTVLGLTLNIINILKAEVQDSQDGHERTGLDSQRPTLGRIFTPIPSSLKFRLKYIYRPGYFDRYKKNTKKGKK
jgi:hypothetical protein